MARTAIFGVIPSGRGVAEARRCTIQGAAHFVSAHLPGYNNEIPYAGTWRRLAPRRKGVFGLGGCAWALRAAEI